MSWSVTSVAVVALVVAVATGWLRWRYKHRRLLRMASRLPGPPALPVVGNAFKFMVRPEEFVRVFEDFMSEYGDVVRVWLGAELNVIVSDPDDVRVLLTSHKTSVKGPQYKYMADLLGGGILSGSGPVWRRHRKIASPNYGRRAIEGYTEVFNREAELLVQRFKEVPADRPTDIYKLIVQTTTYTVCQTLMGLTKEECLKLPHLQTLVDVSPRLYDIVFHRMTKWYLQIDPVFWWTKGYKEQKRSLALIREFSAAVLALRTSKLSQRGPKACDAAPAGGGSVVDRFLLSRELDPRELIDETFTVFTSSQEATAKISSFVLLMMVYHPECQEKLYAEIAAVVGGSDRTVSDEDLRRMPYLDAVFREVIRLFPIGALLQRTVTEDVDIGGGTVPAGSSLVVPMFHLHRDPRHWADPDAFDPDRFSPRGSEGRNPNCYIPFSLGPMDCLGRHFATKLVKTIVVKIMQEFELTPVGSYEDLRVIISISATTLDGFLAFLTSREKN